MQAAGTPLAGGPEFAKNAHAADMANEKPIAQYCELIRLGFAAEKRNVRSSHEFRDWESQQFACSQGTRRSVWNGIGHVEAVRGTGLAA